MKRTDLVVGEFYEFSRTRDHGWSSKVMVLDDKPWRDRNAGSTWNYYRLHQGRFRQDDQARGVAVARESGDQWVPDVIPLQQIVPAGTASAARAAREAEARKELEAGRALRAEEQEIAKKLGVQPYTVSRDGYRVKIPVAALNGLLAEVEFLNEQLLHERGH